MNDKRSSSRRQFLKQAGGAAAALAVPTFVPRSVLAGAKQGAPSDRINIGCIGVGNQGRGNLGKHLKQTVAVCEVDATRLAEARERVEKATNGPCAAYDDYRRLLDNKDV